MDNYNYIRRLDVVIRCLHFYLDHYDYENCLVCWIEKYVSVFGMLFRNSKIILDNFQTKQALG